MPPVHDQEYAACTCFTRDSNVLHASAQSRVGMYNREKGWPVTEDTSRNRNLAHEVIFALLR